MKEHGSCQDQSRWRRLVAVVHARRVAPVLAWVAGVVALLVVMSALGRGALAAPRATDPGSWGDWLAARTAPDAAIALLRVVVIGLASYLLAVTVLAIVLRLGRAGRLVTMADVVTLPFVRSLVQAGLGLGLAGATVATVGSVTVEHVGTPPAADVALVSSVSSVSSADDAPPVMQKIETPAEDVAAGRTWTVAAGDHLWSVAERVLAESWGRTPGDHELVPYWEQLVEANRDRLADRDNPDLIFPGQEFVVPAPPPAP